VSANVITGELALVGEPAGVYGTDSMSGPATATVYAFRAMGVKSGSGTLSTNQTGVFEVSWS